MDFLTKLPKTVREYSAILVVVDKLSKMTHFIPTTNEADAVETAQLYFREVFHLHGMS
jgi:hypothetical protein